MACAQCHNHKFDPFSQKDYYRLLAFFDNGEYTVHGQGEEVVDSWIVEPELELPTPEQARRARRRCDERGATGSASSSTSATWPADLAACESAIAGPAPPGRRSRRERSTAKGGATLADAADGSIPRPAQAPGQGDATR